MITVRHLAGQKLAEVGFSLRRDWNMPSWDSSRKMWRAQVKSKGQRHRPDFLTKREAAAWEVEKRKELEKAEQTATPTGMDLATFSNKYLDYALLHYVDKTYKNKQRVCRRLLKQSWQPSCY